MRGRRQD
ncbi:rCG20381 [Rattus norvegicus]|nr:rCG20381 [Rattus norvegicus]